MNKYNCPCCNFLTFDEPLDGTYEICPVCGWEDDKLQLENPDYEGGANEVSLNQAKQNFKMIGAINTNAIKYSRKPTIDEIPKGKK